MADRSDYKKSRTNLIELQSDAFNSEVNKSLIENTFNRFLTKDETVEVIGTIGEKDASARADRQIEETDVHRQGYQLQPLVHHKIATVDYATSSKDILNELKRLGVDPDRFPKWGDTERFNFAPPVDIDKLINYTDYYWFDPSNQYVVPQYVVMKTACATHSARLSQKQREIAGVGDRIDIYNVSVEKNQIIVLNNMTPGFPEGMTFDINGSFGLNGIYEVESAEYRSGFTYITPSPAIESANYGGGYISFDTVIRHLTQSKNAICDGTAGWDAAAWDDNSNPKSEDGIGLNDPVQLQWFEDVSQDTLMTIADLHPEWVTYQLDETTQKYVFDITNSEAKPIWKWLDQPKPEFIHKWDWTGLPKSQSDWQIENKWIHKLDLPAGAISNSTRAIAPIIEYLPNLELNEWSYTAHQWMYREDPIREQFTLVDFEPTDDDYYNDPDQFLDKWLYVGPTSPVAVNHQPENTTSSNVMSLDSLSSDYRLVPLIGFKITKPLNSQSLEITSDQHILPNQNVWIHTPSKVDKLMLTDVTVNQNGTQTLTFNEPFGLVTAGDMVLMDAKTRPFNVALFPFPEDGSGPGGRWTVALAGQQNTRVYLDGREQIGNYTELLFQHGHNVFTNGVMLDTYVSQESVFDIGIDPSAEADSRRTLWQVRTVEWTNDQDFRDGGRPTATISPIRYRYHQQRKVVGVTSFPKFDIYHPNGETAFRANEIFTYEIDQSAAVEVNIGLRVKKTDNGRTYHFKQLLIDYDNGPLFCYKDFDELDTNPTGLFSIWRTSNTTRYVPRYVNEYRRADGDEYYNAAGDKVVESVAYGAGDWEIPSQLNFNSSHENRVRINSIELLEHVKTILRNQPSMEGFRANPQYGHRLLDRIDYGVGGTIHEHNDSWDLLASSMFASSNTPIDIINFAATAYDGSISAQEDFVLNQSLDQLLKTDNQFLGNFKQALIEAAISRYELNDNNNLLFGDTTSFFNDVGVRSWPATAPILGFIKAQEPLMLQDPKLAINEVKHHDGHISRNRVTQGDAVALAKRLIRQKYTDAETMLTRHKGWSPSQAAVGNVVYDSYLNIPIAKLNPGDCWVHGTDFRRFEVVSTGPSAPSTDTPAGALWLRAADKQLMVRTSTLISPWEPLSVNGEVVAVGDISHAWKVIDLTDILNSLILEIETRLYAATLEHNHNEVKFSVSDIIRDNDDVEVYQEQLERAFLEFAVKRQIAYPFASNYVQIDPFTWNYKGVDANERDDEGRMINIWSPFADERPIQWKATWQGTYKQVYGTYYPHLEPWILQGFENKPSWWDAEYKDTTGTRRWKAEMWDNVIANRVYAEYEAPSESSVAHDPETGRTFKVMEKIYNYVPVNTTRPILNATNAVMYNLDDLFPLYDSRLLEAKNFDIANAGSIGKPMIRRPEAVATVNFKAAYAFGDFSPIELQWRKSTQFVYDQLKIAFVMQPVRFMHKAWGLKFYNVGGLNVNTETNKVFAHSDTIFHGDVVDGQTYISNGLNQWYVNFIRRSGIDFKVSNFRELWTSWTAKMAYQFGGFINTRTFNARTAALNLIREDYSIFSKKAPGYETKWMDALNITVANYGQFRIRNGVRVPVGDGSDWTFTVSLPADSSRVLSYYGTRRYNFTVIDEATGTLRLDGALVPWETGDVLYVKSTGYLPFPMDEMYTYYAIRIEGSNSQFRLSRTPGGAHRGEAVVLRTSGEGTQIIGEAQSLFYAYAGEKTDVEWKHHTIDKSVVNEVATPFAVQGVQSVIDLIDGYAEYKRDEGFVFNDSTAKEPDQNTGRLVSWQTEIERAVNTIYTGLGRSNTSIRQYGNVYEIEVRDVSEDPDTFVMKDVVSPFQYGDKVYMYTTGTMPTGLAMNTAYYTIPNEANPHEFKLASTALNAYDEIAINVTDVGSGKLMIGAFSAPSSAVDDVVEVNPFKYNLWIKTPAGILSDVFTGGESFSSSEVLLYDQYGRPLPKGSVLVFRNDNIAHINVRANMLNDVLVNNSEPTQYNLIHLGGIKAYIDGYEHVVLFNDYMTNGQLVYDGYIGMNLPRFDVQFERAENRNLRPNVGGYFLHDNEMVRNLEAQVNDMRKYYQTYGVNDNADYVKHSRALLGYEDPTYLDHLNTPAKSKFAFWKGMIQRKGSQNAIQSFINSEHFVDAKVDEFWAYKIAEFGDARPRFKPKVRVLVDDAFNNDLRIEFTDVTDSSPDRNFTEITLEDQTRWVNLPMVRSELDGRNMTFDAKTLTEVVAPASLELVTTPTGVARKLVLEQKLWGLTMKFLQNEKLVPVATSGDQSYQMVNERVVLLRGLDAVDQLFVIGYVPDTDKLDPIELVDQLSQTTIARTKYWNPIVGKHYHLPISKIDFATETDPVLYNSVDWTDAKVGTTWLDTSTIGYVPYNDEIVYPQMADRIERWGRPADWATAMVYEWVRSDVDPLFYNDEQIGKPLTVWQKQTSTLEYEDAGLRPIHSLYNHETAFDSLAEYDQDLELSVFVNGTLVNNSEDVKRLGDVMELAQSLSLAEMYNIDASAYVTFILTPSAEQVEDELYTQGFKYVVVNEEETPIYYFWVSGRTDKIAKHEVSVSEIATQLMKPQVPYHVFSKPFDAQPYTQVVGSTVNGEPETKTVHLPPRFSQVLIRDLATKVNANDRYTLQFTRFFNLRDGLDGGNSPLDLKNKHSEWFMFRRAQPNKIPSALWEKATQSLMGYKLDDFERGTLTPLPSLERVIYDNAYNTTTRFGLGEGQAFVDREIGISSVQRLIESSRFDTAPVDKYVFLDQHSFDTPLNIKKAMDYIFVNFSAEAVNWIFFELLQDALAGKRDYEGLLKTSFIALHGIKILEISGNVSE